MLSTWVRRFTGLFLGVAMLFAGVDAKANPPPFPMPLLNGPTAKAVTRITQLSFLIMTDVIDLTRYGVDPEKVQDAALRNDWAKAGFDRSQALYRARFVEEWAYRLTKSANLVRFWWGERSRPETNAVATAEFQRAWWEYTRVLTTAYGVFTEYQRYLDWLWAPQGPLYGVADAKGRDYLIRILNNMERLKHDLARGTCIVQNGPEGLAAAMIGMGAPGIYPVPLGAGWGTGAFCLYDYMRYNGLERFWVYGQPNGIVAPLPLPYYPYNAGAQGTPFYNGIMTPWFPQAEMQAYVMQNVPSQQWRPLVQQQVLPVAQGVDPRLQQVPNGGFAPQVQGGNFVPQSQGGGFAPQGQGGSFPPQGQGAGLPPQGNNGGQSPADFFNGGSTQQLQGPSNTPTGQPLSNNNGQNMQAPQGRVAPTPPQVSGPNVGNNNPAVGNVPALNEEDWNFVPNQK